MSDNQRMIAGRYTVGSLIGRGGMADVYEGTDTVLGRKVAIKLLKADLAADPSFEDRFRQEAQASARMAHPTIVRVYDAGEEQSVDANGTEHRTPFIVMEYVRGTVLRDLLHQRRLSVPESIGYAEGVLTALEFSHKAGIIHRDIKAANIMVTDTGLVKVMDFGIARAMNEGTATQAHTTGIVGTAQYFSPEQARGETVDARTDLYSTGVLLYEMLAGRQPFQGETAVSIAYQHVSEAVTKPSVHNPAISPELDEVVLRSLAKDRADRFQSAEEFRDHLLAASVAPAREVVEAPVTAPEPVVEEPIFEEQLDDFDALLADLGNDAETQPEQIAEPEVAVAPEPERQADLFPATEVFTSGPDTNPFAEIGVEFPADEVSTETGKIRKASSTKPSPRLLWGIGSGVTVVIVGLVVWMLTFGLGALNITPSDGGVAVASVANQTFEQGQLTLQGQKLLVDKKFEASATVPEGVIIRTDPPAGQKVSPNTLITVYVSLGAGTVSIPDLKGMTEEDARAALVSLGLTLGDITQVTSASIPLGNVVDTNPLTGQAAPKGSAVNLLISNGKVVIPSVLNLDYNAAKLLLEAATVGYTVDKAAATACDGGADPVGTVVLSQSVPAGLADAGGVITLTVACK